MVSREVVVKRRPPRLADDDDSEDISLEAMARGPSAQQVAEAIRSGICPSDRFFDQFLPYDLRRVSGQHWTQLSVAMRVAEWLVGTGVRNVVDIGSGAGKFCVAAAVATRCSFIGIEQRPRLVEAARAIARLFDVDDRIRFVEAAIDHSVIPPADAYYLYNPFGENLFGPAERLGDDVELGPERFERDVAVIEQFFEAAPIGTYVIKYNGFGGRMPGSYDQVGVDREMPNPLRMWRKTRAAADFSFDWAR
jgi:SAM-dependent methyltransferase